MLVQNYCSATWLWLVLLLEVYLFKIWVFFFCVSVVLSISRILLDYVKWRYQLEFSLGIQQGEL